MKWLHLSDFHTGKDNFGETQAFDKTLELVRNYISNGFIPNVIFITGDIAQSGKVEQYEKFRTKFHQPLKNLLEPHTVAGWLKKIYYVPGNHDVDRDSDNTSRKDIIDPQKALRPTDESNNHRRHVLRRFSAFREFLSDTEVMSRDWLSCNQAYSIDEISVAGQNYSIISINTAWRCQDDSDKGNLLIGIDIIKDALTTAENGSVKIILGHHPLHHLEESEMERAQKLIAKSHVLYLHGHRHRTSVTQVAHLEARGLQIQAGATFQKHDDNKNVNGVLVGEYCSEEKKLFLQAKENYEDEWRDAPQWFPPESKYSVRPDWYAFAHEPLSAKEHVTPKVPHTGNKPKFKDLKELAGLLPVRLNLSQDLDTEIPDSGSTSIAESNATGYLRLLAACYQSNTLQLSNLLRKPALRIRESWKLTDLQKNFLQQMTDLTSPYQDIVLAGGTSSGKTTLAELLFGLAKPYSMDSARVIYVAPTRALAQEKYRAWKEVYDDISGNSGYRNSVILSTGEDHTDDGALSRGDFLVACLVYEKANVLFSFSPDFLRKINLVVIDELHMIENLHRGSVLESLLAKVKFEKERRSTSLDESNPLRVVGITTDNFDDKALVHVFSHTDLNTLGDVKPIVVRSGARPKPVEFSFIVDGAADAKVYSILPLARFETSDVIRLTPELAERVTSAIGSELSRIRTAKTASHEGSRKDDYLLVMRNFVEDWLYSNRTGKRLLVFVPSKEISLRVCENIRGAIKKSSTLRSVEPDIAGLVDVERFVDSAEMLMDSKDLKTSIQSGVLMHNAALSPPLREAIEGHIAKPLPVGARSEIVIATETLSYGVNLQVDDVLFGALKFPSAERRASDGRGERRLSVNAFFNMAGRAGRLNQGSTTANVYIFVSLMQGDTCGKIIQDFFVGDANLESCLFHGKDVAAARQVIGDVNDRDLAPSLLTYPFVRTVLDGMRFLGGMTGRNGVQKQAGATVDEVEKKFLVNTFYWKQRSSSPDLLALAKGAAGAVIDGCIKDDFKLAEMYLNRPRITRLGASVIDTGTEIETVIPLRRSLKIIYDAWGEVSADTMPFILALLAVIVQEEAHRRVIENCPEVKFVGEWSADRNAKDLASRVAVLLAGESAAGGYDAGVFEAVISRFRLKSIELQPLNHLQGKYPAAIHDACTRIFLGMLVWMQGRPLGEVMAEMRRTYDGGAIKEGDVAVDIIGFADGLNWKILFASELLNSMQTNYANPVQRFDAARLSHRVRLGCREDSIPFLFKRRDQEAVISRKEARDLFDGGVRSSAVALGVADMSTVLPLNRQAALRARTEDFVNSQFAELAKAFRATGPGNAAERMAYAYWSFAETKIGALTRRGSPTGGMGEVVSMGELEKLFGVLEADAADGGSGARVETKIRARVAGKSLLIDVLADQAGPEIGDEIRRGKVASLAVVFEERMLGSSPDGSIVHVCVDFPWLVGSSGGGAAEVRLSPASFGVLFSFLARNLFVDAAGVVEVIWEKGRGGVMAARDLMGYVFPYLRIDTPDVLIDAWVKYLELRDL